MEKTNKKTLEEIIRVDHAGERGTIKIYKGLYSIMDKVIRTGSRIAITISEKI